MKIKSTFLFTSFVFASSLGAQTVRSWNGSTGGAWLTGTNWSPSGTFAGDASGTVSGEGAATDIMSVLAANTSTNVGINMSNANGLLTLGGINFAKTDVAALVIGNSSTSASGILQLNGATIETVDKTLVRVAGSANLTIQNRNSGTNSNTMGLQLGITDGVFNVTSGRTLQILSNITQVTSGSGFTKTGTGVMLLGGTNSFTGNTTITEGTLVFRTTASKPTSTTHTFSAGTVLGLGVGTGGFTASDVINAFAGTFTGSLAGITIGATNNIALDNGTFAGDIAVTTRGLEKTDNTGNLTLTGANKYSGRTVVGGGNALVFNSLGNKGDASSNVGTNDVIDLKNGARLDNLAVNTSNKDLNLLGATATYFNNANINSTLSGTVSTETAGLKTFTLGGNSGTATPVFSGTISDGTGQLALTKGSLGQWTLSSANTFTGATIMSAGSLILNHILALQNSPLNTTSSIVGTSSVGLQAAVTTLTFGGLTGNKALASLFNTTAATGRYNTVTALTLNPVTGATHTYDAAIADGALGMSLTKTGLGTQVFTVANTYTGATAINAGTLTLGNGGTTGGLTGSSSITVTGATLAVNRSNAFTQATDLNGKVITGTGGFSQIGAGTTTLSLANSYTGATTVSAGTLIVDGSTAADSAVSVGTAGTLGGTGTMSGTLAVSGVLSPGTGAGNRETLDAGTTTWNGGSIWNFDLSSSNTSSDLLNVTGDFNKGSAGTYQFNFMGSTPAWNTTYTLVDWSGSTTFDISNFSFTGLGAGPYGTSSFGFNGSSLTFTAIPEPTSAMAGILLAAGLLRRRRKQA